MMVISSRHINLLLGIFVLLGCSRGTQMPVHIPQASDSLYTAKVALQIYGTQPDRALVIIDSAQTVGNINVYQADFLRAKVYTNSLESQQLEKAIALCENLLQHDSTNTENLSCIKRRSDVLDVMMDACRKKKDKEHWLQCAIERAELSRRQGMETEALRMEAEIGAVTASLGRREEGLAKLDQTIRTLDSGAPSIDRMDAGIVARKRRIAVLDQVGRYPEIIPDAQAIINKLEDYTARPGVYAEDSFRLPAQSSDRTRYCRFYTAQAWAYLALAYSRLTPPNLAETRKYVRLFEESDFGQTYSGRQLIAPAWKSLGRWDKVLAIDEEVEKRLGTDTLRFEYATILKDKADAASAHGHYKEALAYMERHTRLLEQLNVQRLETQAQEYAARYHAMEQEQALREAKASSERKDAIIVITVLLLVIITVFSSRSAQQRRDIGLKNRTLVRMINELSDVRDASRSHNAPPDIHLFESIDQTIREERLYANALLQRQDIVDRFGINRHALNNLLAAFAGDPSFTAYINGMRLDEATRLLQEMPNLSISEIAEAVGFSPANFREQFKRQYGMTPTEYRQNQ